MKLVKAIKILTLMGTPEFAGHTEDILAARKLGIEALKFQAQRRNSPILLNFPPLPGETVD